MGSGTQQETEQHRIKENLKKKKKYKRWATSLNTTERSNKIWRLSIISSVVSRKGFDLSTALGVTKAESRFQWAEKWVVGNESESGSKNIFF